MYTKIALPPKEELTEKISSVKEVPAPMRQAVLRNALPWAGREYEVAQYMNILYGVEHTEANKHEIDEDERAANASAAVSVPSEKLPFFLRALISDEQKLEEALEYHEYCEEATKS